MSPSPTSKLSSRCAPAPTLSNKFEPLSIVGVSNTKTPLSTFNVFCVPVKLVLAKTELSKLSTLRVASLKLIALVEMTLAKSLLPVNVAFELSVRISPLLALILMASLPEKSLSDTIVRSPVPVSTESTLTKPVAVNVKFAFVPASFALVKRIPPALAVTLLFVPASEMLPHAVVSIAFANTFALFNVVSPDETRVVKSILPANVASLAMVKVPPVAVLNELEPLPLESLSAVRFTLPELVSRLTRSMSVVAVTVKLALAPVSDQALPFTAPERASKVFDVPDNETESADVKSIENALIVASVTCTSPPD